MSTQRFKSYETPEWDRAQAEENEESNRAGFDFAKPKPWNSPENPDILAVFVKEILSPIVVSEAEYVLNDLRRKSTRYPDTETAIKAIAAEFGRRITDAALVKAYDAHIAIGKGGVDELKKMGRLEVAPDLPVREILDDL